MVTTDNNMDDSTNRDEETEDIFLIKVALKDHN